MKRLLKISLAIALIFSMNFEGFAQLELPRPSPNATITQDVGITEITISYSSPGVKGRTIWGDLVPYDQAWRAGANSATQISFDKTVSIQGKEVKAGTYQLFITPKKDGNWLIHINTGNSVFAYNDDDGNQDMAKLMENDVVTINAKAQTKSENWERLAYFIAPLEDSKGTISMRWGKMMVSFDVEVHTQKNTMKNIGRNLGNWYSYASSAEYYMNNDGDMKQAKTWANTAVELRDDHFFTHLIKAQVAFKMGDKATAKASALKAKEVGEKQGGGFYNSRKAALNELLAKL